MTTNREELRESVVRALYKAGGGLRREQALRLADAVLAVIIPACQEAIRDRGPSTQDMRSTEICDALDAAAAALAVFLPGGETDGE